MRIRLLKGRDKPDTLSCARPDGSSTWTSLKPGFGPHHDLAHYCVETALGLRNGFYGLIAAGHSIQDVSDTEAMGGVGRDALLAECVVGALQSEARGASTLEQLPSMIETECRAFGLTPPELPVETIAAMGERLRGLWAEWQAKVPGESLELSYPAADEAR